MAFRISILGSLAASILFTGTALAGPLIFTAWSKTDLDIDQCKARAASLLRETGFRGNLQTLSYSVWAENGQYAANIRCISDDQKFVFFVVAGPDDKTCNRYVSELQDKF